MEKKIVVYHNDTNRIFLGNLGENEARLLFALFEKLKNKHQQKIEFNNLEIREICGVRKNLTKKELKDLVKGLWDKIKAANFWILLPEERKESNYFLFKEFSIFYDETMEAILKIHIVLNEYFKYLLNDIISDFTTFELEEFNSLPGRYSQTLYRLLKQYKGTGYARFEWDFLKNAMNIPKCMRVTHIDHTVLNVNVKYLKPFFKNLDYRKIKDKNQRGRGGKVVAVEFFFEKQGDCIDVRTKDEKIEDLRVENGQLIQEKATVTIENNALKEKNEALKKVVGELQEQNFKMNFKEYTAMRVESDNYGDTSEIIKVEKKKNEADLNSKVNYYIMVTLKNLRSGKEWNAEFKDIDNFRNYLIKHSVLDETKMHNIAIADHRKININFR